MAEILYTNNTVNEEEEAKDDEVRPPSALYQKCPWQTIYKDLEIATKNNCQQYTADPCWTLLTRSWPREIQCGSMIKMNHDECSHQTYGVDLQQDDDHSHDQVHCGSMM